MKELESWMLSYLLNSVWQVPLLFAAGWVAARALRRTGAAAEHRVWATALVLESVLPALSALRWDWLGGLLAWRWGATGANGGHVAIAMDAGTVAGGLRMPGMALDAILVAYCVAIVYFAARFGWHWHKLNLLRREAVAVTLEGDAAICLAQCAERFGVDGVSLAASRSIFGPVTMGLRRKVVVFPADMLSGLPRAGLQTVLAHEFAHMRRNDFFKNLMYELVALPASYHPLLWFTRERVTESREIVCDQMAAATGGRAQYARSLLRLASLLVEGAPARTPHAIGIFDTKTFERRLMRLAEKKSEMRGARRLAAVVACVAFGVAACGTALAMGMHVDANSPAVQDHATSSPRTLNVSPSQMAGNRIGGAEPIYPVAAKKAKIQGKVVLDALIGRAGNVERVTAVSGPKELRQSAIDAVRTWKYKPFLLNGNPVQVRTKIHVIYTLAK